MTPDEVGMLYAKIMGYDHRKLSKANLHAWAEQAELGHWTLDEALDAVAEHHRTSDEYLMPVHVHRLIRTARQFPQHINQLRQLEAPPPADEQTRKQVMAMVGKRFRLPRDIHRAGRRAGRRPPPDSPEHAAAMDKARAELDAVRCRAADPPTDEHAAQRKDPA